MSELVLQAPGSIPGWGAWASESFLGPLFGCSTVNTHALKKGVVLFLFLLAVCKLGAVAQITEVLRRPAKHTRLFQQKFEKQTPTKQRNKTYSALRSEHLCVCCHGAL